ncbi:MAG: carbohydrate kinase family protein, partial [Patescibacteria group bacterium]
ETVIKNFKKRNVDASYITKDKKAATGFSVIITADNSVREHVIFTHRGANNNLSVKDLNLDKVTADWLYVSSLPKINWEKIMEALIKTKKNIVWNPGNNQLKDQVKMKRFLKRTQILVVNRDEAMEFKKLKSIKSLIKYIHDLGVKMAVITEGEVGAYVYDGKKYYFMKARSAKAVDTVGVGDAFSAAFTSALVCGKNIKEALSWGMRNSASVVSQIGAQNGVLTRKQITRK